MATEAAGFRQGANRFAHLHRPSGEDGIRVTPSTTPQAGMGFQDFPQVPKTFLDTWTPEPIKKMKTGMDQMAKDAAEKKSKNVLKRFPKTSAGTVLLLIAGALGGGLGPAYRNSHPAGALSKSMRAIAEGMGSLPENEGHCFAMPPDLATHIMPVKMRNGDQLNSYKSVASVHPNNAVESANTLEGIGADDAKDTNAFNWYAGTLIRGKQTYTNSPTDGFGNIPPNITQGSLPTYVYHKDTNEVREYNPYVVAGNDQYQLVGKWEPLDKSGRQPTSQEMAMAAACAGKNAHGAGSNGGLDKRSTTLGPDELKKRTRKKSTGSEPGTFASVRNRLGLSSNISRAQVAKKAKAVKKRAERTRAGGATLSRRASTKTGNSTQLS